MNSFASGNRRSFLRHLVLICGGLPLLASCAHQRRSRRVARVGLLVGISESFLTIFRDEMRKLGYTEGENLQLEVRRESAGVEELAQMELDLFVAVALPIALGFRKINLAIPMVIATCPGMISNGFARTLEHPGGNVTGIDELPPGVTARRLTLLKTAAPSVSRIALLSTTPGRGGHETQLADAEQIAPTLGVSVKPYRATSLPELESALAEIVNDGMDGLANFQGALSLVNRQRIVDFAAEHRLPAVYQATMFAEAGGLMSWAPSLDEQFTVTAHYAAKILDGANPGDLPIQYPPNYYLTIHAGAARNLGLTLPPALLAQAKRVLS
jgi:putative ABC transport system substrate-binding protein